MTDYVAIANVIHELRAEQDKTIAELREQLAALKPTCAVCGRIEPCELDKDEMSPCTFDPSPRQLYDDNCKLRAERDALAKDAGRYRLALVNSLCTCYFEYRSDGDHKRNICVRCQTLGCSALAAQEKP
jgi:hypothetical protein